jgi:hypothetical protein
MNRVPNLTTRARRKLFFRGYQVLRAKIRVYGKELPPNQVLVKLRETDRAPMWVRLERDTYDREKYFRAFRNLH